MLDKAIDTVIEQKLLSKELMANQSKRELFFTGLYLELEEFFVSIEEPYLLQIQAKK
jgi:hypothetical protein